MGMVPGYLRVSIKGGGQAIRRDTGTCDAKKASRRPAEISLISARGFLTTPAQPIARRTSGRNHC